MSRFLGGYGFAYEDMVILTDNQPNLISRPTKANMIRAMQWLVEDAKPHDSLFFHFSGHGSQCVDWSSDQDDVYTETISPLDFEQEGMIVNYVLSSLGPSYIRKCTLSWLKPYRQGVV